VNLRAIFRPICWLLRHDWWALRLVYPGGYNPVPGTPNSYCKLCGLTSRRLFAKGKNLFGDVVIVNLEEEE
jgi:hypothetical protein